MIVWLLISLHTGIQCNFCDNFLPTCRIVVAQQKQGLFLSVRRTSTSKTGLEMASNQKNQVTEDFTLSWSIYCPLTTPRRVSQFETMHSCTFQLCYLQRFSPKLEKGKQHWSSYQDTANLLCFLELLTTNQALIPCEDSGREERSLPCGFLTYTMGESTQRWRLKTVFLFLVV